MKTVINIVAIILQIWNGFKSIERSFWFYTIEPIWTWLPLFWVSRFCVSILSNRNVFYLQISILIDSLSKVFIRHISQSVSEPNTTAFCFYTKLNNFSWPSSRLVLMILVHNFFLKNCIKTLLLDDSCINTYISIDMCFCINFGESFVF